LRTIFNAPNAMMGQSRSHCEVGQRLAAQLGLEQSIQAGLLHMYERWDGQGGPRRLKGEAIALPMRVVHVVHDVETYRRERGAEAAVAMLRQRSGRAYDPHIAEKCCQVADQL